MGPIRESFTGAWQKNVTVDRQPDILANPSVYSCVTGISSDIAKNRILLSQNQDGIWVEVPTGSPYWPVLRKPNHYQNRIQFIQGWITSKLLAGNTYVLKERDQRGIVTRLYVLDPLRVRPLIADDGSIYYRLEKDALSHVADINAQFDTDSPVVPASEIIHDMMPYLWHPLVGVSPLYAAAMSATLGNKISTSSTALFGNAARPGGMLLVPGHITDIQANKLKEAFESGFSGANVGRIAILSDGMKFEPMILTAEANKTVDQYKLTIEDIARAFHYPIWKLTGQFPAYSSGPQALTQMYYAECLHPLIEELELCLDEGLEFPLALNYGTELDLENLMRMDTASLYEINGKGVNGGWLSPDEARARANYKPVPGGSSPMMQQQNWSLEQLEDRKAIPDSTVVAAPTPTSAPTKRFNLDLFDTQLLKRFA